VENLSSIVVRQSVNLQTTNTRCEGCSGAPLSEQSINAQMTFRRQLTHMVSIHCFARQT
jgi:hypothetical protein